MISTVRALICKLRGRHVPQVALDPMSGYYLVCENCRYCRLLMELQL